MYLSVHFKCTQHIDKVLIRMDIVQRLNDVNVKLFAAIRLQRAVDQDVAGTVLCSISTE